MLDRSKIMKRAWATYREGEQPKQWRMRSTRGQ